jgi:hypothetical protein
MMVIPGLQLLLGWSRDPLLPSFAVLCYAV